MSSFHTGEQIKKSYKSHWCEWCHELIPVHSSYRKSVGSYYGDFYSYSMHNECSDACCEYMKDNYVDELPSETMKRGSTEPK